ncbi:NAD-dependent epimerase/dehydratase family protein [Synechococcus sp. MU1611]|uniref:NAD-dependent epimerase/dehydratase family protein n=1 Tax=Synechococcus sp. MU1611 TaxID=2508345 RepID=UPI001CF90E55|nr:NAD-dependent epimerase/dehydratase family protein [Synechococcus sp. MU1611]MCB4412111.1 NAD-dependent epimerase/dehydratase family protein [Synechococcus sp. MU1611]
MILLIGAGGYLGSILSSSLVEIGEEIITVSSSFQWSPIPNETRFICDASMFNLYSEKIDRVTCIIYMAGSTDILKSELNPADDLITHMSQLRGFFESLSSVSTSSLRKLFFFSSAGAIYGDSYSSVIPHHEESLLAPLSIYGKRNMLLEDIFYHYSKIVGCQYCALRISNPFGITQNMFRRKGLINALLYSAKEGYIVSLRGNGQQKRDYLFAKDFCQILIGLIKHSELPPCINVCSGLSFSAIDLVSLMNKLNIFPNISTVSDQPYYEVRESRLSNGLLTKLLEQQVYPLTSMEEALSTLISHATNL